MDNLLMIIGIGALIIIIIFPFLKIGTRPRCRECGSYKVGVQKIPTGMRSSDFSTGGEGGGHSAVQRFFDMKYRCNDCQAQWTATATETS